MNLIYWIVFIGVYVFIGLVGLWLWHERFR